MAQARDMGRSFVVLAICWTVIIVAQVVWEDRHAHQQALGLARTEAVSSFNKDLVYRRWATRHGGVYVPVTESTPPNPYLSHIPERDITTPSGKKLTLMNPAYMTRQVHEMGAALYGGRGHITSLRPIRPLNGPDAWEARALHAFERGTTELVEVAPIGGEDYLRLMRPLVTEKGCLKCHAVQGYRLGEIRGGLSVSVPFAPYHDAALLRSADNLKAYAAIWLLGIGGLGFARRRIRQSAAQRAQAEAARVRLERELAQTQKMELVGRLAGGVAHDFNNMLTVIRGYAEVAIDQSSPATPLRADLQQILDATERSSDLTRQLLAFARKQDTSPQQLDLNAALAGMLKMLRRLIGEDVRLQFSATPGLWTVYVDPSQLDRVLINLCLNARDAITNVGTVTIELGNCTLNDAFAAAHPGCAPGDYVRLAVGDDGQGMDVETMGHLFEPFFTTKANGKGTGLGLATVYGIVRQANGCIDVQSERGRGTTLTIYFPRYIGDATTADDATVPDAPPRGSETILLVEDEVAILRMTRTLLERLGYRVLAASSPTEAMRWASEHAGAIDLLLTDVVMPGMNGRDLMLAVSEKRPGIRCLYMSGYTADVIGHHGVLAPDVDFIEKPFTRHDLASKVRAAIDRG